MFWKSNKINSDEFGINECIKQVNELKRTIIILQNERESLKNQIVKYEAILKCLPQNNSQNFKPHENVKEAVLEFKNMFSRDFYCLDEVDVDILNTFLAKLNALKTGDYRPSLESVEKSNDFFKFKKALVKREYIEILYNLLDIKRTTRRFEIFDAEIANDEIILMIEKIYLYIELQKTSTKP